jgi:hypothetical protein
MKLWERFTAWRQRRRAREVDEEVEREAAVESLQATWHDRRGPVPGGIHEDDEPPEDY